ncbi:MAG: hypothetical protein J0H18_11205 [Rhizobiales bacterium]|nr:hypothetical protein [Hyphomicrobiales bacterium]OJY06693.1 MAG: hypothetical protein BGP07_16775 [Rhizobiales bacterium 63-22]
MKLGSDWKRVLKHAWSIRLLVLAGILSGFEAALPLLGDSLPISARAFAILTLITVAAAFVARIISQKEFRDGE